MNGATAQPDLHIAPHAVRRMGAALRKQDHGAFTFWLGVALAIHALALIGFVATPPREIGDPNGFKDAIAIEMVSDADLRSMSSVADRAPIAAPPTPPAQAQPPPTPAPAQPAPPEPAQAAPPFRQTVVPHPAPETKPTPADEPAPPTKAAETASLPEVDPDALKIIPAPAPPKEQPPQAKPQPAKPLPQAAQPTPKQTPQEKQQPAQPKTERRPPQQMSKLDLSLPPMAYTPGGGPAGSGGAGLERPAGYTRSGENDAFARGVIQALQKTMPYMRDALGRVTVRITLDMNGGLVKTEVIRPSNIAGMDQGVVFATRQSSFPFPPRNATAADLVFMVTYIYR